MTKRPNKKLDLKSIEDIVGEENITTGADMTESFENSSSIVELKMTYIFPDPNQPRKSYDEEKLEELADSITEHGLLQPITVKKESENRYILLAGERRYRAHKLKELRTIKAIVTEQFEEKRSEAQLMENLHREDLKDFEIATTVIDIWKTEKYKTKQELAKAISKKPAYISKCFAIFNCCEDVLKELRENVPDIGLDVLSEISREKDSKKQLQYYNDYLDKSMTRNDIRNSISADIEEEKKNQEQLHDEKYAEKIKAYLKDGASLYSENNVYDRSKDIDIYFNHENDKEKLKNWVIEIKTEEEKEKNREKLNDSVFFDEMKDYINKGASINVYDSSAWVCNNSRSINYAFYHENDIMKLQELKEEITAKKEEQAKEEEFSKLINADYENMELDDLKDSLADADELITKGMLLTRSETYIKIYNLCKEKDTEPFLEEKQTIWDKMLPLVTNHYKISVDETFLRYPSHAIDRVVFIDKENLDLFKKLTKMNDENDKMRLLDDDFAILIQAEIRAGARLLFDEWEYEGNVLKLSNDGYEVFFNEEDLEQIDLWVRQEEQREKETVATPILENEEFKEKVLSTPKPVESFLNILKDKDDNATGVELKLLNSNPDFIKEIQDLFNKYHDPLIELEEKATL